MINAGRFFLRFAFLIFALQPAAAQIWQPDRGDGTYQNPVIWADYSDPDLIRVGQDFYMTASSFNAVPALPILHSTDLVNWEIINHAVERFPDSYFDIPQHGKGVWAPSLRYHDGWFYIYWGDPDRGIFRVRTRDPRGEWSAPVLVKKAFGNIDPCPLWDEDGKVYLVHAFANSRAGVSHVLQLQELTPDGASVTANRNIIISGLPENPTLEGPKFYKRDGWYYIFAPAGGVATGWQMVYRSRNIWGPYQERRVLEQGKTGINGPHQGGWVTLENGEDWFVHFQEKQPFGRIVHLQPMRWVDGWPVMGLDEDGDGTGEPVARFRKPSVGAIPPAKTPPGRDEFDASRFNPAWQWQANFYPHWYSMTDNPGYLRLNAVYHPSRASLWMVPNILAQKIPGPQFTATVKLDGANLKAAESAGLVMLGLDYAALALTSSEEGYRLNLIVCENADQGFSGQSTGGVLLTSGLVYLRAVFSEDAKCRFSFSVDGSNFIKIGEPFSVREGRWIGAKIGLFALSAQETGMKGFADVDWFRLE
ncbi:MAG TPA: glycoside hydrolase 43 family protein [Calditrichia bacterium]|nr:glycoside hydrolase 43 family protein [Calditrichia bacterium]